MPERWERIVKTLNEVDAPSSIQARFEQGPIDAHETPTVGRRITAGVVAFVVAGAALTFGYQAFRPETQEIDRRQAAEPTIQPLPNGEPRVSAEIPLAGDQHAGGIAAADGSVWVGVWGLPEGSPGRVLRIDQATNEEVATIDVGATPYREKIAATSSGVWIASEGVLQRIDPATNQVRTVATLPGRTITAIAADNEAVWALAVADGGSMNDVTAWVVRIDPADGQILAQIPLATRAVGYDDKIRIGAGSVWVSGVELLSSDAERGGGLVRIDPATNAVTSTWDVNAFDFAITPVAVLVRSPRDGVNDNLHSAERWRIDRYDIATGQRLGPPTEGVNDADLGGFLAADEQVLWLAAYDDQENVRAMRVNASTLEVETRSEPIQSYFHDATIDPQSATIWIATVSGVVRVDIA